MTWQAEHDKALKDALTHKTATLSDCGTYRYRLGREWGSGIGTTYGFVGVNPSTADADEEDATTKKWRGFVERWDGDGYQVVNLFAFRATDVKQLKAAEDPFGPENGIHMRRFLEEVDVIVPCWGSLAKVPKEHHEYVRYTLAWLRAGRAGKPIKHLGLTKGGDPKHPLMLPYSTQLEDFK